MTGDAQGDESTTETEADTVRCQGEQQNSSQRRRLRLVWNEPPHRQVRAAQVMFEELSRRVGPVPVGAPVPRIVREHRWSVLNVPLMWDAAGQERSTPTLDWLCHVSTEFPALQFNGGSVPVSEAARTGWMSLRTAIRAWGIAQQDDLSTWLRSQGFPGPQPGNHISARAQEFVLSEGCRHDACVAMLEAVFVTITLETGRRMVPATAPPAEIPERCRAPPTSHDASKLGRAG